MRSVCERDPSLSMNHWFHPLEKGLTVWWPSAAFSHSGAVRSKPSSCLSWGMYPKPFSRRDRTEALVISLPVIWTLPASILWVPKIAPTSSCWPLPSTPAIPKISPCRTSNETASTIGRSSSSSTVTLLSFIPISSLIFESVISGFGSSEPTINSARSVAETSDGLTVATVLPCRRTVIVSAISRTSSSLWSIKMMVAPLALSSLMFRKSSSTS